MARIIPQPLIQLGESMFDEISKEICKRIYYDNQNDVVSGLQFRLNYISKQLDQIYYDTDNTNADTYYSPVSLDDILEDTIYSIV